MNRSVDVLYQYKFIFKKLKIMQLVSDLYKGSTSDSVPVQKHQFGH